MNVGIIAFSFGLREHAEPSLCNVRLARAAREILLAEKALGREVVLVAQREVALGLMEYGITPQRTINSHRAGPHIYLDSEEVVLQATEIFSKQNVFSVIVIAQPFLQAAKCRNLLRRRGFGVEKRPIGWIGFDPKSDQPWTRGPASLLFYALQQVFFNRHGDS